jgi:hypothetical protein
MFTHSYNRREYNSSALIRLLFAILKPAAFIALLAIPQAGQAGDRDRKEKREHHNYIIERQEAGSVSSGDVPIIRRIRGSREIDIYRDGSMFEKNNFVGFDKH